MYTHLRLGYMLCLHEFDDLDYLNWECLLGYRTSNCFRVSAWVLFGGLWWFDRTSWFESRCVNDWLTLCLEAVGCCPSPLSRQVKKDDDIFGFVGAELSKARDPWDVCPVPYWSRPGPPPVPLWSRPGPSRPVPPCPVLSICLSIYLSCLCICGRLPTREDSACKKTPLGDPLEHGAPPNVEERSAEIILQ